MSFPSTLVERGTAHQTPAAADDVLRIGKPRKRETAASSGMTFRLVLQSRRGVRSLDGMNLLSLRSRRKWGWAHSHARERETKPIPISANDRQSRFPRRAAHDLTSHTCDLKAQLPTSRLGAKLEGEVTWGKPVTSLHRDSQHKPHTHPARRGILEMLHNAKKRWKALRLVCQWGTVT